MACSALNPAPTPTEPPADTVEPSETPAPPTVPAPTRTLEPSGTPEPTRSPRPTTAPETESVDLTATRTPDPDRGQGLGEAVDEPAEAVDLDVCTLLAVGEVTAALGAEGDFETQSAEALCVYLDYDSESPSAMLTAAQGGEAQWLLAVETVTISMLNGEGDMEGFLDAMLDQAQAMSVAEIAEDLLMPEYEAWGCAIEDIDGFGDAAYWLWCEWYTPDNLTGKLFAVRDDAYLALDILFMDDEEQAQRAAFALGGIALERLPPAFDVLDFNPGGREAEPPPTVELVP
jgi:hypothetical protein